MTKYTTIAGDMWDGIAYKTLGDEAYTDKLMKQNPEAAMRLREWEKALSEGREKTDKTGNIR